MQYNHIFIFLKINVKSLFWRLFNIKGYDSGQRTAYFYG